MKILAGDMVHLDAIGLTWSMTATGVLIGLLGWSALAGVIAWLIAVIYNRLPVG